MHSATFQDLLGLQTPDVWTFEKAFAHLQARGQANNERTVERRLHELGFLAQPLGPETLRDELGRPVNQVVLQWAIDRARSQQHLILFLRLSQLPTGQGCMHANDSGGAHYWVPMPPGAVVSANDVLAALGQLQQHLRNEIAIFPHGELVGLLREAQPRESIHFSPGVYLPVLKLSKTQTARCAATAHLKRLEDESVYIMREAVAEADNPVMLYSVGKDSSVMLHLARKAFYPGRPPFPLLHVDTRWKFQEMYLFRDHMAHVSGMDLLVYTNPEAIAKDINPFDHGSALHTAIAKTEALKRALDDYEFDVILGGARREEEKSRAKERIFSFRTSKHRWDPKQQRPELWNLYNTRKNRGESIRVFPLSNWTELDIWQYVHQENIPVVPLYFAKTRPVVCRDGMILLVDDGRFRRLPDEEIVEKTVRFRSLGCYPLTGAVESTAETPSEIILELMDARNSERQGRAIDSDAAASMEKKKQDGYF